MTDKLENYYWPCSEGAIRLTERDEWTRLDSDGKLVFLDMDKCVMSGNNAFASLAIGVWNAAIEEAAKGADFVLQPGGRTLNDIIRGDEEINQEQRTAPRKLSFARAIEVAQQRTAEACAKAVERLISGDGICADNEVWIHDCADAIRRGDWREYL